MDKSCYVYVTSGVLDAAVLFQAGYHAISLISDTVGVEKTLDVLLQYPEGMTFILAGDNDENESGQKVMRKLQTMVRDKGRKALLLQWPDGVKDANDAWLRHNWDLVAFRKEIDALTENATELTDDAKASGKLESVLELSQPQPTEALPEETIPPVPEPPAPDIQIEVAAVPEPQGVETSDVVGEPEKADAPETEGTDGDMPESAQTDLENGHVIGDVRLTDSGNAERLVAEHGDNIRYLNDDKSWNIWNGSKWSKDETSEIARLAKGTARGIGLAAFDTASKNYVRDKKDREVLAKWSFACEARCRLENMVILASREAKVSTNSTAFDNSPWLFNCANGTIDLETNTFRPARREDLLSKQSPVAYDQNATCPRFDAFLAEIIPLPDTRRFLQSSLGYTLSGHAWEKLIWFLIGESGDNGKTTFIETVRHVFGKDGYAINMNVNSLLPKEGQGPSPDIARLRGIRFASASESDQAQRLSTATLKRLTGTDTLTARLLFKNEFEFAPSHKIWLATNHPPRLPAEEDATWNRIARVPFNVRVSRERQDPRLQEKLKTEASGILNWIFEGWKIYRAEGIKLPTEVQEETERYRDDSDVVKEFLRECIAEGSEDIGSTKLYQAYKSWFAQSHNQRQQPMAQKAFSARMKKLGHPIEPRRNGSYICGVGRLLSDVCGNFGGLDGGLAHQDIPFT